MSQGPRRGWVRTVLAGLGAVLCAGVVGCTDIDKPKDSRLGANAKQPGPGLPGTPRIPGAPGAGVGASGVGSNQFGAPSGVGRAPVGTGFGTAGMNNGYSSVVPSVAPNYTNTGTGAVVPAGGAQWGGTPANPAAGAGAGFTVPPGDMPYPPAAPGTSSAPLPPSGYRN